VIRTLIILLLAASAGAQSVADCKRRYNSYLNFKNTLNGQVAFDEQGVYLKSGGKRIFAAYSDELVVLGKFFAYSTLDRQASLFQAKGARHFTKRELDSLDATIDITKKVIRQGDSLPLRGYRVALDAGHFGTNMKDAAVEQKYLYFVRPAQKDTVRLFESLLTYQTSYILKHLLEEQGAEVFLTRNRADHTSFDCTYQEFLEKHRRKTLDSLRSAGTITPARHKALSTCSDYTFFWDFFRDYDLANRAIKVNRFDPHVTAIIHYNVDEKNTGWKTHTQKNFTMAFIAGAFTAGDLAKSESRLHFLRLMLTDQLDRSEKLAAETVKTFKENLQLPVARAQDATYLYQNCISTKSPGVFCRNLVLCRKINSPLVYGESLYQDNIRECEDLMRCNVDMYGVTTSERITKVAGSYFEALFSYLKN
jgi:N-acetylmuramoyl-L-alanine amidase